MNRLDSVRKNPMDFSRNEIIAETVSEQLWMDSKNALMDLPLIRMQNADGLRPDRKMDDGLVYLGT